MPTNPNMAGLGVCHDTSDHGHQRLRQRTVGVSRGSQLSRAVAAACAPAPPARPSHLPPPASATSVVAHLEINRSTRSLPNLHEAARGQDGTVAVGRGDSMHDAVRQRLRSDRRQPRVVHWDEPRAKGRFGVLVHMPVGIDGVEGHLPEEGVQEDSGSGSEQTASKAICKMRVSLSRDTDRIC